MTRSLLFAFFWAGLFSGLSAQFVSTTNTGLGQLESLAVDPQGNRYVCDRTGNRVLKLDANNTPSVYSSTGFNLPTGLVRMPGGEIYVTNHLAGTVSMIPPGGGPATVYATGFSAPRGLAADAQGNLYVGEYSSQRILKVAPGGAWTVLVGNAGITGTVGGNDRLEHLAIEPTGDLIATIGFSSPGRVYRVALPSGVPTLLASSPLLAGSFAINVNQNTGNIYITGVTGHRILSLTPQGAVSVVTGDGTNATLDGPLDLARFSEPSGITVDPDGNIWISQFGGAVRRVGLQPAEVPTNGLRLWLRADRGLLRDGSTVNQWLDQSGSANHATPSFGAPPVVVNNEVNDLPVVRFNGVNNGLATPAFVTFPNKRGAVFAVARVNGPSSTSGQGFGHICGTWYNSPGTTWQFGATTSNYAYFDGVGTVGFSVAPLPPNAWGIVTLHRNSDTSFDFYKSGILAATTPVANNQPASFPQHIGYSGYPGISEVLNGDIAEIIYYDRELTAEELEQVNTYLADKYSFNGDVPLPTAQGATVCSSGSAMLTATGGDAYRWYDSPDATVPLATTASFTTPVLTSTTTYYVANFNGQLQSQRVPVIVTVLQPGAACDDGDPNTTNDVLDSNCSCVGQPINTISFTYDPTPLCADNMTLYSVFMTATGSYNFPGNNWAVELSDNTGSFASPTVVAFAGFNALFGELVFQIPLNTPAGTGYRIRVRSTDPVVISADNGVDLTVVAPILWYADYDGDGFGDPNESVLTCAAPPGFVANDLDNCVGVPGIIGSPCDDDDTGTINDVLSSNCVCAGTPVIICTNDLTLEFQTDGSPQETSWEIRTENTNALVSSGGPLVAPFGVQTEFVCLPDGCYTLRVLDAGGDGMTTGGYILRTLTGAQRIIDNRNNFSSGSVSAISGGQGFCLPLSNDKLVFTSCDKRDWVSGQYVVAAPNAAVSAEWIPNAANNLQDNNSGYEFWIFDPNGSYSFRRFRSHNQSDGFGPVSATRACHMKLNNWGASTQVPANVLMNVRVRARVNGVNGEFGPACRLMIDPVRAACPLTKLMDIPDNQYLSCGATRQWGTGNFVHARPVSGANRYQFRFRLPAEGFTVVRQTTTYFLQLNWTTLPLEVGKTYDVDVRVSKDGGATWCTSDDPWGDVCQLTIGGSNFNAMADVIGNGGDGELRMFPNPNRGDVLNFSLSAIEEGVNTVNMDIHDLSGKRVSARTLAVAGNSVNTTIDLAGELAAGMYLVNITAGTRTWTERLVIQP